MLFYKRVFVASSAHSQCECSAGFLAIPFGEYALFQQVDSAAYDTYSTSEQSTEVDPNELVGFWCGSCPEGGDCQFAGTTLENVKALPGYYMGVDLVGSAFFPCLNEACGQNGTCAEGYVFFFGC